MSHVAIVTDSASDLPPDVAAAQSITVVPLVVSFGAESFRPGVDLTTEAFWERMTAPDAPFPTTAAASPGDFKTAFEAAFAGGADAVVCVNVSGDLSGTLKSAQVAAGLLEGREVHVIDSRTASMGVGQLAQIGAELAAEGVAAAEIARVLEHRKADVDLFVALDTLEYLKRGGRISGARAAVGTMLSIKPIITVQEGDRRERGPGPIPPEGARTGPRAADGEAARTGGDPPQHQCRRRRVPGAVHRALGPRRVEGPDDADRAVGRAAPRPRLRRRGDHLQALRPRVRR